MDIVWKGIVIAVCGLLALAGNWPVRALLARLAPAAPTPPDGKKPLPGGRWIGLLERAATYACIVAGFPAGIAFVLAVKGLGRYPELKVGENPHLGEQFIVGTLASMLWAAAFAGIALGVIALW